MVILRKVKLVINIYCLLQIGRYLLNTCDEGIIIKKRKRYMNEKAMVSIFMDADHAADVNSRKSMTGIICLVNRNLCNWWLSSKQTIIARSSSMSKLFAIDKATFLVDDMLPINLLYGDIKITYLEDNENVISWILNPRYKCKKKTTDITIKLLRKRFRNNNIENIRRVCSEENGADFMTKSVNKNIFQYNKSLIIDHDSINKQY